MAPKSIGEVASSLFGGWPGSLENVSCSRATPDLHRCALEVALEQGTFSRPPGLHPKRPLAPSPINLGEVHEVQHCTRVSGSQLLVPLRCYCKTMQASWMEVMYTPPICITIRLLFVSRRFCRHVQVKGVVVPLSLCQCERIFCCGPH